MASEHPVAPEPGFWNETHPSLIPAPTITAHGKLTFLMPGSNCGKVKRKTMPTLTCGGT